MSESGSKDKSFSRSSPSENEGLEAVEKLYISQYPQGKECEKTVLEVVSPNETGEKRERESCDIYKFYNGVMPQLKHKRGPYRNGAVKNRCRLFAKDFYEYGFAYGTQISLDEFKYWIVALELAHDRLAVDQYVHRLVMYGYFYLENNGKYTFLTDLPDQTRLPSDVHTRLRFRLKQSLATPRQPRRRSY